MSLNIMMIPVINRFTCHENQLRFMIKNILSKKMLPILDYANENPKDHKNNFEKIKKLISNYPNNSISVKLSSLNFDKNYLENLTKLALENNSRILIDAENFIVQDKINMITNNLMKDFNKNNVVVFKTYQMYRKDSMELLKNDFSQSRDYYIGCKLVRGAYFNEDKKHGILFDKIDDTHNNYNKSISFLSNIMKRNDILMCATHNEESINKAKEIIKRKSFQNIEFAQLLGMSDKLSENLAKDYRVYKYLPYGNFQDTIPYLIRRLYENYPMILNLFK